MVDSEIRCHSCGSVNVFEFRGYRKFFRVTSDCKPWKKKGRLVICQFCGLLQKIIDKKWFSETDKIYRSYSLYQQANGCEQVVFREDGQSESRSVRLVESLLSVASLPTVGRMLEIGCGAGSFLSVFKKKFPQWKIFGFEIGNQYKKSIESIAGPGAFFTGDPLNVPGSFDLIVFNHVLEHIVSPSNLLIALNSKIAPLTGKVLINGPCYTENPSDFLIVDHCSHFDRSSLKILLRRAGYVIEFMSTKKIPKELTVLARPRHNQINIVQKKYISRSLNWLALLRKKTIAFSKNKNLGIFGSSIAASWLFQEANGKISFFIDEDLNRCGRKHLKKEIISVDQIRKPVTAVLPFRLPISRRIKKRIKDNQNISCWFPDIF